jgi:hypothetical protein
MNWGPDHSPAGGQAPEQNFWTGQKCCVVDNEHDKKIIILGVIEDPNLMC